MSSPNGKHCRRHDINPAPDNANIRIEDRISVRWRAFLWLEICIGRRLRHCIAWDYAYKQKKLSTDCGQLNFLLIRVYPDYFTTTVVSAAAAATIVSPVTVSTASTASTTSTFTVSAAIESVAAAASLELPQEKSDALNTTASNKTNFFISFSD